MRAIRDFVLEIAHRRCQSNETFSARIARFQEFGCFDFKVRLSMDSDSDGECKCCRLWIETIESVPILGPQLRSCCFSHTKYLFACYLITQRLQLSSCKHKNRVLDCT